MDRLKELKTGEQGKDRSRASQGKEDKFFTFAITFALTFCLWILLSGRFDRLHLSLGIVSCVIISIPGRRLIFPGGFFLGTLKTSARFAAYLPWLFLQILLANLHLLYLTFHPQMGRLINPKIIRFDSCLKSDLARTTFANSITLTPGTITVYAGVMGGFAVHCIDDHSGQGLPGQMETRIAEVFDE